MSLTSEAYSGCQLAGGQLAIKWATALVSLWPLQVQVAAMASAFM